MPWVGKDYAKGYEGKKILVMGHVHVCGGCDECSMEYHKGPCPKDMTSLAVRNYLNWEKGEYEPDPEYKKWLCTYRNFTKAIFGTDDYSYEECESLWNHIMFYNYVQTSMSEWYEQPNDDMYNMSELPFAQVLKAYKPDLIIVWGSRAYGMAPWGNKELKIEGQELEPICTDEWSEPCYEYSYDNHVTRMMKIHHPSMYFSWSKYHELIMKFLKQM